MFRDLLEYIGYRLKQVAKSRLFPVTILFSVMFVALILQLFQLQIVEGEAAQEEYTQTTKKTVSLSSTRGNIYDRNGNLLAYNKLVYVVTVTDEGDYSNGYEKNIMLLELIEILDSHNETINTEVPIIIDSSGEFQYSSEGNTLLRFLRDMYGLSSINDFDEDNPSDITAEECFEYLKERYGIGKYANGDTYEVSDDAALKCINIRYSMAQNSYQKYVSTTVAEDISTETMQDILEHSQDLLGVDVEEDYIRVYNYSEAFSHIIGYTGTASTDEIEELNEEGGDYSSGDVVGKTGIEAYCELDLQGTKGERVMYVDSEGHIVSIESEEEAETGSDVYLTLDAELQEGIYHLIEQSLAGIILDKLEEGDVTNTANMTASQRKIGIKQVYFQLINNNILDMDAFADEDASEAEQRIYATFQSEQTSVLSRMESELTSGSPAAYADLDEDMQAYMTYAYSALEDAGILTDAIDSSDETYVTYHTDETISLQEFLRYALTQSGWVDTSLLDLTEKYTSAEDTYQALVTKTLELLEDDDDFSKEIYEQLIDAGEIAGRDICLALFAQGVLEEDEEAIEELENGNSSTAFQFIYEKIENLELTPAQLALDPCSAAVTIIDPDTGEVLAMVSYPGYDNNQINDSSYYYSLLQDQSSPLYSTATQARTAPGSTFKMVSAIAALEEGLIDSTTTFTCEGVFTKLGLELSCTSTHGSLNVVKALEKSCNSFFSEVGYLLSLDSSDTYSESLGVSYIQKYASLLGLSEKSGVEVTEMEPNVSDSAPIPSAIGQGTHAYTNVQMARYVTTIATEGTVYDLTLLDHVADSEGKTIAEYSAEVLSTAEVSDSTWEIIQEGMIAVVESEHSSDFDQDLELAGKTGTAEENKLRGNHALFVGYAPYDDPEYAIAVTIPNGYSSTYACRLANLAMELAEGKITLDEILEENARTYNSEASND